MPNVQSYWRARRLAARRQTLLASLICFVVTATVVWSTFGLAIPFSLAAVTLATAPAGFGATSALPAATLTALDFALTANAGEKLTQFKFTINNTSGITQSDFNDDGALAGGLAIALFQDTDDAASDALNGGADQIIASAVQSAVTIGSTITLTVDCGGSCVGGKVIPSSMTGRGEVEYFLAFVLDASASAGNSFTVSLATGAGNTYVLDSGTVSGAAFTTDALTVAAPDTTPPTVTAAGGPPDGQQFVPLDVQVDRTFSEALASGTITTSNVSLKRCTAADQSTAASACATLDSTNRCDTVELFSTTRILCNHTALSTEMWYAFTLGTGITDTASNALLAAAVYRFKTSSINGGSNNTTPPMVMSSYPQAGIQNVPINTNLFVSFSIGTEGNLQATGGVSSVNTVSNVHLKKVVNFAPADEVCTDGTACVLTWGATTHQLKIDPASNLLANTEYELCLLSSIQNTSNANLPGNFCVRFKTGASADSTVPTLRTASPTVPANAATGVSRYLGEAVMYFSEAMDPSTMTLTNTRLCIDVNSNGCSAGETRLTANDAVIYYNEQDNSVHLTPKAALTASTVYCFEATNVKDIAGNIMPTSVDKCFTTGNNSDSAGPKLLFVDADTFKLVAHVSEPLAHSTTQTPSNYTLECPVGVTASLVGKTINYKPTFNEIEVTGLGLQTGQDCRLTLGTGITDLAGNAMDTSSSNNVTNFEILNFQTTGGFLGSSGQRDFASGTNFGDFWENPERCQPRTMLTSATSNVECQFPVPEALATGAKFILTFPSGFDVSNVAAVAASSSWMNADLNGPSTGTTTISAVAKDAGARTVTVTIAQNNGTMLANDMMKFELSGLVNPTVPSDENRVAIIVKDASGIKVGQTINASPFPIATGGALSISGSVYKDSNSNGTKDGGEGLANIKVFCDSFGGFGANGVMSGHQEATTNASGAWSISNLSAGQYGCGMQFDATAMGDLGGGVAFQNITLDSASKTGVDFKFADLSSTGKTLSVTIASGASLATKQLDVFCAAGSFDSEFSAPTMKTVTLDGAGAGSTTLKLQPGKTYNCGLGPHIAFESFASGGAAAVPDFNFMPPKPVQVVVPTASNPDAVTFTLLVAGNSITGFVKDGSNNSIANVFVHAAPLGCFDSDGANKECFGGFTQSKSDGSFTLNIAPGTYMLGADAPGMPSSSDTEVTVATNGSLFTKGASISSVTIKMVKSSTTIAGQVLDESGNGIKYAHVNGQKIASGGTCASSTPAGGFADSPTDASGNYTLYVADGTWCVRAFSPAYGEVANKTVIMASASQTGQNLQATASDFGTISGTVQKNSAAASGAFVNCYSSSAGGGNGAQTSSDGAYSLKVKAGSGYTCEGFIHGAGPLTPQTGITVTASSTTTVDLSMGNPGTVNVTMTGITDGFVDVRDSSGRGAGSGQNSSGVYTIKVPAGAYTVRGSGPKYGELCAGQSVTVTAGGTHAITCTPPANLRTVTGRVTDGSSNVAGATVFFMDTSTGRAFSSTSNAVSGSSSNLSVANVPDGSYTIRAAKNGYESTETSLTVASGSTALSSPLALTAASGANGTNVTVSVQLNSAAYAGNAKIIATKGTKIMVVGTEKNTGQASLPLTNGTWSVKAVGDNGKESSATDVVIAAGALVGSAPTLSLANAITGFTTNTDSSTFVPKNGGLIKPSQFSGLELNAPGSTFSTSDSNTGNISFAADPTLKDIDPGTGMNFVGTSGYDITPADSNGNAIETLSGDAVTLTLPYADADVTSAGVDEDNLLCGSFNEASQSWETFPTVVDTANNKITCQIDHFSSFGVIGSLQVATTTTRQNTESAETAAPVTGPTTTKSGEATITAAAGGKATATTADGGTLQVSVPTNALTGQATLTVAPNTAATSSAGAAPTGYQVVGANYFNVTTTKASSTFDKDLTLTFSYADSLVTSMDESSLGLYWYDETSKAWKALASTVDTAKNTVSAAVNHLTLFAIMGQAAAEAAPTTTAVVAAGDLIQLVGSPTVYRLGDDGARHAFPDASTFASWGYSFSNVKMVTQETLQKYPLGTNVVYQPGSVLKLISVPKVYLVETPNVLRWVTTEAIFKALGYSFAMVKDLPEAFFGDYTVGEPITEDNAVDAAQTVKVLGAETQRVDYTMIGVIGVIVVVLLILLLVIIKKGDKNKPNAF